MQDHYLEEGGVLAPFDGGNERALQVRLSVLNGRQQAAQDYMTALNGRARAINAALAVAVLAVLAGVLVMVALLAGGA